MQKICFYNVENLFPPDSIKLHKVDHPPSGLRKWNLWRYQHKLQHLSKTLHYLIKEEAFLFMGLAEVSTDSVISDLLQYTQLEDCYGFIHYNSLDERGVDVAFIYNKKHFNIQYSESIRITFDESISELKNYDTTRDVLYVKGLFKKKKLHIFTLHLPSKREHDVNAPKRKIILNHLSEYIKNHISEDQSIIIMGDFNENPNNSLLENFVEKNKLQNPFKNLYLEGNFSTFHHNQGLLYDQIMARNLFCHSPQIENPSFLRCKEYKRQHLPFRTYAGSRYLGGFSDHFPISLQIDI